jgi:hypothetical protein
MVCKKFPMPWNIGCFQSVEVSPASEKSKKRHFQALSATGGGFWPVVSIVMAACEYSKLWAWVPSQQATET